MNREVIINNMLDKLSKSKFRSSFHLKENDIVYIKKVGLSKICNDCYDLINKRLAPSKIDNDGRQTPYHGHPVFVACHATATCCRGCLYKWHHISRDRELSHNEVNYIVYLIMSWIRRELNKAK